MTIPSPSRLPATIGRGNREELIPLSRNAWRYGLSGSVLLWTALAAISAGLHWRLGVRVCGTVVLGCLAVLTMVNKKG